MPVIPATWKAEMDCSSRPAGANSSGNPTSKITKAKWTEGMTPEVDREFRPRFHKKKKKKDFLPTKNQLVM
jgi:hypothetical protein